MFSLHLSHLPGPQQRSQVEALKRLAASLPEEAPLWPDDPRVAAWSQRQSAPPVPATTLLLGDFNFEPQSPCYSSMLDELPGVDWRLVDGWREAGGDPLLGASCVEDDGRLSRLDYLFASDDLRGRISSACVNQDCRASDHFPLYFTIDIQPGTGAGR